MKVVVLLLLAAAIGATMIATITGFGVLEGKADNEVIISRVIDGDTVELAGGDRVRLLNINTPEKGQYLYREATKRLEELVKGKRIRLEADAEDRDKYDRLLRHLFAGNDHLNRILVEEGYAAALIIEPNTDYAEDILAAEQEARQAQRGIWQFSHIADAFCVGIHYFRYNAAGNDNENINGEFVEFRNSCTTAVDMTGWTLQDSSNKTYTFPALMVENKTTVTLHSGKGGDNETDLYWGNTRPVWNNNGDRLRAWNREGVLMLEYGY